ncbi:MAG TPA: thioredoxin family protein [Bryobacteraceae bacterium]
MRARDRFTSLSLWLALLSAAANAAAPEFHLRDTSGAVHTQKEWAQGRAVLLFFVGTDCPVSNSYVPEMNRIFHTYAPRGIAVYAVQADLTASDSAVAQYAKEYRYEFPMLLDPRQQLVRLAGATVTPQAAVLSPEGKVLYLGRIDNRVEDFGSTRPRATEFDLRNALDAVLAGKPVPRALTKSIGCAIDLGPRSQ